MGIPIIGAIGSVLDPILDKFIPDADKRLEAKNLVINHLQALNLGQLAVNRQEAAHRSLFVAGWRPAVGWICGAGLAYNFIVAPFLSWGLVLWAPGAAPPPMLDIGPLTSLLTGMLGMAALRTYEKRAGVSREQ